MNSESEYEGYFEARSWGQTTSEQHFWYYDGLTRHLRFAKGAGVLEIGFGDGRFLDWCRSRGLAPVGVEIQEAAVAKAVALGHEVYKGPFSSSTLAPGRQFQMIVCLDVLEHLTINEIRELFRNTISHLAADGRYLVRFPNGNSPFVGPHQFSDSTHKIVLTPGMMQQLTKPLGLQVEHAFNDRILPGPFVKQCRRRLAYGLRSTFEAVIGLTYFGHIVPLDPNVFVILTRLPEERGDGTSERPAQ
ncbi:MAG TPA: methyltransferase domain-containing protein [Acetobacteraceae bacterium]|nr:methyltransferase domain-containing protein [Acetobacteraceae bacterium]